MKPEDLQISDTLGVVLVAPWGYGKRWWSRQWQSAFAQTLVIRGEYLFSDAYFAALDLACQSAGLPTPEPEAPLDWFKSLPRGLGLFIEDWENHESLARVRDFWAKLWQIPQQQLTVVLCTRKQPQLELASWVAAGGQVLDASQLVWSLEQTQSYWQEQGLDWQAQDHQFWQDFQGWPLGLVLAQRYRTGDLSESVFEQLIQQALKQQWPPFITESAHFWLPETQTLLSEWQLRPGQLSAQMLRFLEQQSQMESAYWLWKATHQAESLAQSRAYLERGLRLTRTEDPFRLRILTRLAHDASLSGRYDLLDQALSEGAKLLELSQAVDCAAWYYLQANRFRQLCRYAESAVCIQVLQSLTGQHPVVINFQTRALILQGLTAYQQGEYDLTRAHYQAAMHLAIADQNEAMQVELTVMLAFLDALTGNAAESLPTDLESRILALPLESQPLIWLNLTFYQILGERVDLNTAQSHLQRVRHTSLQLEWSSLEPFIADVEARLWRYFKQEQKALEWHKLALKGLDPASFEFLFARLNYALTLIRSQQKPQAERILVEICETAQSNSSLIILREAQAALSGLQPGVKSTALMQSPSREQVIPASPGQQQGWLKIQCFGSFQVSIDKKVINRWPRKRARHMLIHLLLHPHGIHRESLADWLTQSDDLDAALRSLDVHIHALRKVLEPNRKGKQTSNYILFQDACYRFHWDCFYDWDVERFEQGYQDWLNLKQDPANAKAAATLADQALSYYQGPFLPDLEFADEWIAEREAYARHALDLLRWRLQDHLKSRHYEQAEALVEQWLSWDDLSEAAYAQALEIAFQMKDKSRLQGMAQRLEQTFLKALELPAPDALLKQYASYLAQLIA